MRRESKFVLVRVCASAVSRVCVSVRVRWRALLEERWWHWEAEISVWSGFPGGGGATPYFVIFLKCFPLLRKKKKYFFPSVFDLRVITKSLQIGACYVRICL